MSTECIVLDFDGTFTEVDAEARPFVEVFRRAIAEIVGPDIAARWDATRERVLADPDGHGWENEGRIVAPAHADPYVLSTSIAQLLVAECSAIPPAERAATVERVFGSSYPHAAIAFRPDARMVVEALVKSGLPIFVVTNSRTEHVQAKLEKLAPAGLEHVVVRGDARKFVVGPSLAPDPRFDALPASTTAKGLARPILLRRGRYFDVLKRLWERTGTTPETTLVCGDTWELDLAMPAALGAHVHLVLRENTYAYERAAVDALGPRGGASESLLPILTRLVG